MARYLLLEFDADSQCDALVTKLADKKTIRVVGMFQKPTKFCSCPKMDDLQQRGQVTRGERFGWWVHRSCRKAHGLHQSPKNLLFDGHPRDNPAFLHTKGDGLTELPIGVLT